MWPSHLVWSLKARSSRFQLSSRRLVAAEHDLAAPVLEPLDEDLDRVADLDLGRLAGAAKFLQRDAAFGLQADVDDDDVIVDPDDGAPDDGAFEAVVRAQGLVQHRGEIVQRRAGLDG